MVGRPGPATPPSGWRPPLSGDLDADIHALAGIDPDGKTCYRPLSTWPLGRTRWRPDAHARIRRLFEQGVK
jgi:hypothetical protein